MRIKPYRTVDNVIEGAVITFVDINELKITKEALSASELHFRRLFEAAQYGILTIDVNTGKIAEVNQFLEDLMGYSKEQLIMKTVWDLGFLRDVVANKDKFQELQEKEFVRYDELPLEAANGRSIDVEFISSVYTVNGQKVMQCAIRELKAAEVKQ